MAWLKGVVRVGSRLVFGLGLVAILLLVVATQTPWGKEFVLREVLSRVEGAIHGELMVTEVSSPGLLQGFTFKEVRILGEDGRPFLLADSVRAGVSGPSLLRGDLVLSGVVLWRPRITVERLPDQAWMNVVSIFAPPPVEDSVSPETGGGPPVPTAGEGSAVDSVQGEPSGDQPRSGRTILLQGVRVHEGSLEILTPLSPEQRAGGRVLVAPGPDGAPALRRMSFQDIDLSMGTVSVREPGRRGERFEIQGLSFEGRVWREPFRVTAAEGELRREPGALYGLLESVELPNSAARGRLEVRWGRGERVQVEVEGEADPIFLADLRFIEDRLPEGVARGPFGLDMGDDGVLLDFRGTEMTTAMGSLGARGGLLLGREIAFRELDLDLQDLDVGITDAWVPKPLPLRGWMDGSLSFQGDLEDLQVDGLLDFTDSDSVGTSKAYVSGLLHFRERFAATSLEVTLAPLEWGTLASISPAMTLRGPGSVRFLATGSLDSALGIDGEVTHVPPGMDPSRVTVDGWIRQDSTQLYLNLSGELRPLSVTSLGGSFRNLPFTGEYAGTVELRGPVSDLEVTSDLETSAGPLSLTARFDARKPADNYVVHAEAEDFLLSNLLPKLPEPSSLSGAVFASGRGFSPDSIEGDATVFLSGGQVGALEVDTAALVVRVREGTLLLDALVAETELAHVEAGGSFGLASDAPPGELTVQVESESLTALRPFLMKEPELVLDSLTPYDRDYYQAEGVDLDTVPTAAEVAVEGRVQGRAMFRGGLGGFAGEGSLDFQGLRFRTDFVESGTMTFSAQGFPGEEGRIQGLLRTDSVNVRDLGFQAGEAEVDLGRSDGRLRITAHRARGEEYLARGTYALEGPGLGAVNVDELTLLFDSVRWNLGGPAAVHWSPEGYRVRDFQLVRPGEGSMRIRADGFLPFEGEGDFSLTVEGLNLSRVAHVFQLETPLEGVLNGEGRVTGSPGDPKIEGTLSGNDLRFGDISLDRLASDLSYEAETVTLALSAQESGREVIRANGVFPADLRLRPEGSRFPAAPVDLAVAVDSFPAGVALAFLEALENVQGSLTGEIHFGGTSQDLAPSGEMYLEGGSASFPALGVRHNGVEARFGLSTDGVVNVDGSLRSGGRATVSGSVTLDSLTSPGLDLTIEAENFVAVNRRDVQARLSGRVEIKERYRSPWAEGALTVEQGVLMVEEVARTAEVVDLSNPAFFNVVDTTLVTLRPIIRASQNPFLQNLRLYVALSMERDSWLRGRDLNVEMAGDLDVYWDRTKRDLALAGDLQAVRGVYSVLGRQFQVEEGTVSFQGTPGINPNLNIRAVNRLRTFDNDRLDIIATVEGNLLSPRVSLSSDAPFAIAESDLVSYLIFGRPTYALTSGQSSFVQGAAGQFLGAGLGATANVAMGLFSSELGSVFTRNVGLDFLAITQGQDAAPLGTLDLAGTVAHTQVEIGQYVTDNVFATLTWRPLTGLGGGLGGTTQSSFAGLRMEWRLSNLWAVEGFVEDRFARRSLFRAADLGYEKKILGFFLYREWGY